MCGLGAIKLCRAAGRLVLQDHWDHSAHRGSLPVRALWDPEVLKLHVNSCCDKPERQYAAAQSPLSTITPADEDVPVHQWCCVPASGRLKARAATERIVSMAPHGCISYGRSRQLSITAVFKDGHPPGRSAQAGACP